MAIFNATPPAPHAAQPVDLEYLYELVNGDEAFLKQFLHLLIENTETCLQILSISGESSHHQRWMDALSELKNTARAFGAHNIYTICTNSPAVDPSETNTKKDLVRKLQSEVRNIKIFLENRVRH